MICTTTIIQITLSATVAIICIVVGTISGNIGGGIYGAIVSLISGGFWAMIINALCKSDHKWLSWILTLPNILGLLIILFVIIIYVYGKSIEPKKVEVNDM